MYRTIDTAFWTDPTIQDLPPEGKLLCLYLITNPHAHVGGIYYLPDAIITLETGIANRVLNTLWDTLSGAGFCRRDKKTHVVWVVKMFFYQGRGEKNERAVANHLGGLHNSFLVKHFLSVYPTVNKYVRDRVSKGYPAQDEIGIQEQEQEQEQECVSKETLVPNKSGRDCNSKAFARLMELWNAIDGVVHCREATKKRLATFGVRFKEETWKNSVRPALEKLAASDFCRGVSEQGWKADIDWFLKPDSVTRLIEGKYDNHTDNGKSKDDFDLMDELRKSQAARKARKVAKP